MGPPAFCGAFSLKPTVGRHLSQLGVAPYAGHLGIDVTGGFITRSALALESAWRAVWDDPCPQAADPTLVPLMWDKEDAEAMANYPKDDIAYRMVNSYCKDAEGLPLAVQVVGRPFKDEQVLRLLRELESKPEV